MRRRHLAVLLAAALSFCLPAAAADAANAKAKAKAKAPPRVPASFIGAVTDGPMLDLDFDLGPELSLMRASGVKSARVTFTWSAAQPYASFADIPTGPGPVWADVNGVPTDFTATDRLVRLTAGRDLDVLPVVLYAPPWATSNPDEDAAPPKDAKAFARYVGALARRYGSNGSYWAENPTVPKRPVRNWQIWNEPNIRHYWPQPFARGYVKMLRATRTALRRADPRARIVLAGLTNESWTALTKIYKAGGRRYFDAVAIHPYTKQVDGLKKILAYNRFAMKRYRDSRKPIYVTELSWPSAEGKVRHIGFNEVTESEQADRVRDAYTLLARYRRTYRIAGAYWYTWLSVDRGPYYFNYAGLRKVSGDGTESKPAFAAFRAIVRRLVR